MLSVELFESKLLPTKCSWPLLGPLLLGSCVVLHSYQVPDAAAPNLYWGVGTPIPITLLRCPGAPYSPMRRCKSYSKKA